MSKLNNPLIFQPGFYPSQLDVQDLSNLVNDLPLPKEKFKMSTVKKAVNNANTGLQKAGIKAGEKVIAKVAEIDEKRPHTGIRDGIANFNSGFNIRSKVSNTLKKAMNNTPEDTTDIKYPHHSPRSFTIIPQTRPCIPLLDMIDSPADLKGMSVNDLLTLSDELREYLLYSVGVSGGHFGANLGVVELTVALHTLLETPSDQLLWDVGHQAYAHKALTGRREQLPTIRSKGGLTAFPERSESEYDTFGVGHSSTVISAGLGMSLANRLQGKTDKVACVVGDGAMTAGMAFEAMNDAVQNDADLLVVLNDNDMSISTATGGFAKHLSTLWHAGYQVDIDEEGEARIRIRPEMDEHGVRSRHLTDENEVPISVDNIFRALGFNYLGPFDGHDLPQLLRVLERAKKLTSPVLVHVYTTKGKGFEPAEIDPVGFHAIGAIGSVAKVEKKSDVQVEQTKPKLKYSQVFGQFICDKANQDERLIAITPAMESGSGMTEFAKQFSERFFDVAIAEQHAVTLAGGMATQNMKPIVAIYSSFLQRGYDQLVHDIALQNLDVTFAIDRAGLVGEDGATHAGVFDYAFMRCLPNVVLACPKDENECYHLLNACYEHQGVTAVRYPRGVGVGADIDKSARLDNAEQLVQFAVGKAVVESEYQVENAEKKLAILAFGTMTATADKVAKVLAEKSHLTSPNSPHPPNLPLRRGRDKKHGGIATTVVNMRWVKPLDTAMIDRLLGDGMTHIATIEEHVIMGGAGSAVNEYLLAQGYGVKVKNLGIPDRYIAHGSHDEQLADCGLDFDGVLVSLTEFLF